MSAANTFFWMLAQMTSQAICIQCVTALPSPIQRSTAPFELRIQRDIVPCVKDGVAFDVDAQYLDRSRAATKAKTPVPHPMSST